MTAECMDEAEAAVLLSETSAKPLDFRDRPEQAAYGRPKLTARAASKYLQDTFGVVVSARTLANYRWAGRGPKFYKCSGLALYGPDHLDEWALEQLGEPRTSTSDTSRRIAEGA